MLVQSHERYDTVAKFDPGSGLLTSFPRPARLGPSGTDGWYSVLGSDLVVFYRHEGRLHLRVSTRLWRADTGLEVSWEREGNQAVLTIGEGSSRFGLSYDPPTVPGPPLASDLTPFVESEDWDLGLFIANVLNDQARLELVRDARR